MHTCVCVMILFERVNRTVEMLLITSTITSTRFVQGKNFRSFHSKIVEFSAEEKVSNYSAT